MGGKGNTSEILSILCEVQSYPEWQPFIDGFELSVGAELQYHLNPDATIFLAVDTVQLENHRMNSFGIGVRFYLGALFSGNQ